MAATDDDAPSSSVMDDSLSSDAFGYKNSPNSMPGSPSTSASPTRVLPLSDGHLVDRRSELAGLSLEELRALAELHTEDKDLLALLQELGQDALRRHLERMRGGAYTPIDFNPSSTQLDYSDALIVTSSRKKGSGDYGYVVEGKFGGATVCAVKIIGIKGQRFLNGTPIDRIRTELAVLEQCRHPNLVPFYGYARKSDTEVAVLMELADMDLGTCFRTQPEFKAPLMTMGTRLQILQDIANGLSWLHTRDPAIIHLDLKFANVLKKDGAYKLTDFGLSALLPASHDAIQLTAEDASRYQLPGNLAHMAPEIINNEEFTTQADVFSFGILAWEVFFGAEWSGAVTAQLLRERRPMPTSSPLAIKTHFRQCVSGGLRPEVPVEDWGPETREVLDLLWQRDPAERPTMQEATTVLLPYLYYSHRRKEVDRWVGYDARAADFWIRYCEPYVQRVIDQPSALMALATSRAAAAPSSAVPMSEVSLKFGKGQSLGDIAWLDFWTKYMSFVTSCGAAGAATKMTASQNALKAALGIDPSKPVDTQFVTIERFGQVIGAFGPFVTVTADGRRDPLPFFTRVVNTLNLNYFFPVVRTQAQTVEKLHGQEDGRFFGRFSSQPRCALTLARVNGTDMAQTRLLRPDPDQPELSIVENTGIAFDGRRWPDLDSVVRDPKVEERYKLLDKPWSRLIPFYA